MGSDDGFLSEARASSHGRARLKGEPFTLGLWGKPPHRLQAGIGAGRALATRPTRGGVEGTYRDDVPLSFVQQLDGNTDAFARSGRHHARSSRRFRCRWRFAQRKKARGVLMLARTPARHARRCDATGNTWVRLFPNVSVCGCVVRRGDDHRSGAERCVPAPGSRGIFQVQVETNSQCTTTHFREASCQSHFMRRKLRPGRRASLTPRGASSGGLPVCRHGEEVRL